MNSRAGYVLVGGKSTRMGRDKALLPVHGHTLVEIVAQAVRSAAGPTKLVGSSRYAIADEIGFVPDRYPGEGPLGGILTALEDTAADWNLIVACDMPALSAGFLGGLLDAAEACGGDVLVPQGPSGQLEPLCAAYHGRARGGIEEAFTRGVRKIAVALENVRTVTWPAAEVSYFQNLNTPEEWALFDQ